MYHRVACNNYCPMVPSLIATQWSQGQSSGLIMDRVDPTLSHRYNVVEKKGRGYNTKKRHDHGPKQHGIILHWTQPVLVLKMTLFWDHVFYE
jgi:hypothetical protein